MPLPETGKFRIEHYDGDGVLVSSVEIEQPIVTVRRNEVLSIDFRGGTPKVAIVWPPDYVI